MIKTETFAYFDNDGRYHSVLQVWAQLAGTGVWTVISARPVEVDPAHVPVRPTRPL